MRDPVARRIYTLCSLHSSCAVSDHFGQHGHFCQDPVRCILIATEAEFLSAHREEREQQSSSRQSPAQQTLAISAISEPAAGTDHCACECG